MIKKVEMISALKAVAGFNMLRSEDPDNLSSAFGTYCFINWKFWQQGFLLKPSKSEKINTKSDTYVEEMVAGYTIL